MAQRLTELLNTHHDKLNEHTAAIKDIKISIEQLNEHVSALDAQLTDVDDNRGVRAGLRDWLKQIRELL